MKPTTDGRWAHLACAIWIPGSIFNDLLFCMSLLATEEIGGLLLVSFIRINTYYFI